MVIINPLDIAFYVLVFKMIGCTFNSKISKDREKILSEAIHVIAWVVVIYYSILLLLTIIFYAYVFVNIPIKLRIIGVFSLFLYVLPFTVGVLILNNNYHEEAYKQLIIFLMWLHIAFAVLMMRVGLQFVEFVSSEVKRQEIITNWIKPVIGCSFTKKRKSGK